MLDRNGPIHKTRIVYNSNVDTVTTDTNIYCSRPTWTLWLARANALHTTCDGRSYAQVLKQGKAIVRTEQLNEKVYIMNLDPNLFDGLPCHLVMLIRY